MEEIKWKETKKKKPPAKHRRVEVKDIEDLMIPDACKHRLPRKEGVKWRSRVRGVYK
jgi:hypothetical protein